MAMTTLPVTSLDESMRLEGRRIVPLMLSLVDQSRDSDQPYAINRENLSRVIVLGFGALMLIGGIVHIELHGALP